MSKRDPGEREPGTSAPASASRLAPPCTKVIKFGATPIWKDSLPTEARFLSPTGASFSRLRKPPPVIWGRGSPWFFL